MKNEKDKMTLAINVLNIIVGAIVLGVVSVELYSLLNQILGIYWILIPLSLFAIINILQVVFRLKMIPPVNLIIITLSAAVFLGVVNKISIANKLFFKFEEALIIILFFMFFVSLALKAFKDNGKAFDTSSEDEDLFNLFYINTSKVHEIAMLIDNKIMKTVEKQRSAEEIIKSNYSLNINKSGIGGTNLNQATENSKRKSVYESFDVKTTKSIMLREIYRSVKNKTPSEENIGNILLFENVELEQQNTDDTVMVLNVLKDSNMKQLADDDSIELNISKMMDEMLSDFTIDYTFRRNNKNYLIRIPYKSNQYFENSYSHNDLQLGKLSIIGIYRGEIDFSKIDSISSRFLEFFSQSYKEELSKKTPKNENGLLSSTVPAKENDYEFKIAHNKLDGEHHLIDLIAIIQEVNIKEGEMIG